MKLFQTAEAGLIFLKVGRVAGRTTVERCRGFCGRRIRRNAAGGRKSDRAAAAAFIDRSTLLWKFTMIDRAIYPGRKSKG
ncbi:MULTISPECIES: hypothetical protein [Rhodopseudomonas]|uniref:hypothetical protein n=1 Tax=Rhodopseudomonas TaxID=1073 RepID=UPI00128E5102|nr:MULTISPECIES: hypothetical protein [Rhodopseudomonas]MDF3810880.1 hypothetical protein [Rhodopseudomonas sp. BAL398]WOK18267.1 hypothetical protein RBJ75_01680 [Rhodopseudomonas sp. BAL398]